MPRKLRIEFEGAIYHVLNRGDRREPIFRDDRDRKRFLETLGEACGKTDWQVHALCLMENHFHLVVETPKGNLVAGMKWFLGTYTARFNRRHKLFGHLFSGRYKSLLVDSTSPGYLKTVCDHVHLNPVRAKLLRVEEPLRSYAGSSSPEYLKSAAQQTAWLRVDRLLGEQGIPQDSPAGRQQFEQRLEERRQAEDELETWAPVRRGWCLGGGGVSEGIAGTGERAARGASLWGGVAGGRGGAGGAVGAGGIGAAKGVGGRPGREAQDRPAESADRAALAAGNEYDAGVAGVALADGEQEHVEDHAAIGQ
jgi:putative transposase